MLFCGALLLYIPSFLCYLVIMVASFTFSRIQAFKREENFEFINTESCFGLCVCVCGVCVCVWRVCVYVWCVCVVCVCARVVCVYVCVCVKLYSVIYIWGTICVRWNARQ